MTPVSVLSALKDAFASAAPSAARGLPKEKFTKDYQLAAKGYIEKFFRDGSIF